MRPDATAAAPFRGAAADPAEFGTRLDGHSFVAKAALCARAIDAAARP